MLFRPSSVPVLGYHKVGSSVVAENDHFLNVTSLVFEQQIKLMLRMGYRASNLSEIWRQQDGEYHQTEKRFVITFDDGYQSVKDYAFPILKQYNCTATVFVVPQYIGKSNQWDEGKNLPILPLMDWSALIQLQKAGWEIGGHTYSHLPLDETNTEEALRDICLGKTVIEDKLGVSLKSFCYPYGRLSAGTPELVKKAGFNIACTTKNGYAKLNHNPFLLPRIMMNRRGLVMFAYRLLLRPFLPSVRPIMRALGLKP